MTLRKSHARPASLAIGVCLAILLVVLAAGPNSARAEELLRSFGAGDLVVPEEPTVDSTGNTYVANGTGNNIQQFDPNGDLDLTIPLRSQARGVAVDVDGNIYAARSPGEIVKFDPDGVEITSPDFEPPTGLNNTF